MTGTQMEWGQVPPVMHDRLNGYVALLHDLAGSDAVALTLFGGITAGSFDPQRDSAVNVLVLQDNNLNIIRELAKHGQKLGRFGIAAPWIMTEDYLQKSRDTFPLELLEIQQNHLTLFGPDLFSDLTFEADHVRLQCERELKTTQLQLQRGLLAALGEEARLDALARSIGLELVRTMRGLLWLRGDREARTGKEVVEAVERTFERALPGVRKAADRYAHADWSSFEALYDDVAALSEIADAG